MSAAPNIFPTLLLIEGPMVPPNIPVASSAGVKNPLRPSPPPNNVPIPRLIVGPIVPPNIPVASAAGLKPGVLPKNLPILLSPPIPPAAVSKSPTPPSPFAILTTALALLYAIAGACQGPGTTAATGAITFTTFLTPLAIFFKKPCCSAPVTSLRLAIPVPYTIDSGSIPTSRAAFSIASSKAGLFSNISLETLMSPDLT